LIPRLENRLVSYSYHILFCKLFMEFRDVMRLGLGIWKYCSYLCPLVIWCQVKNKYRFQEAFVKSLHGYIKALTDF